MKLGWKWFTFGAVATVATPYILTYVSKALSIVPGVTANLQSVSITTTGVGGVINTGLAAKVMGLTQYLPAIVQKITLPEIVIMAAAGGAAVFLGGLIVDNTNGGVLGALGFKNEFARIMEALVWSSVVVGMIVAGALSIPAWQAIAGLAVDAAILTALYVYAVKPLLKMAKLDIMP